MQRLLDARSRTGHFSKETCSSAKPGRTRRPLRRRVYRAGTHQSSRSRTARRPPPRSIWPSRCSSAKKTGSRRLTVSTLIPLHRQHRRNADLGQPAQPQRQHAAVVARPSCPLQRSGTRRAPPAGALLEAPEPVDQLLPRTRAGAGLVLQEQVRLAQAGTPWHTR